MFAFHPNEPITTKSRCNVLVALYFSLGYKLLVLYCYFSLSLPQVNISFVHLDQQS